MVEDCINEECGRFYGVGQMAAEFPCHHAGDGVAAEVLFALVQVVEVLSDMEEVGLRAPGRDCKSRHSG